MILSNGYWVDSYNNKWDSTKFSEERAEELSRTMKLCNGCTNCSYCTKCRRCDDCHNCIECNTCTKCQHCKYLGYCSDCTFVESKYMVKNMYN